MPANSARRWAVAPDGPGAAPPAEVGPVAAGGADADAGAAERVLDALGRGDKPHYQFTMTYQEALNARRTTQGEGGA